MVEGVEIPDVEEFLHFVAETQRIVGFYEAGENEQDADDETGYV
jgi:hypothetical protein